MPILLAFRQPRVQLGRPALQLSAAFLAFTLYLGTSAAWSDEGELPGHLGYAALIISFVAGLYLASRYWSQYLDGLLALTVLSAVISAAASIQLHLAYPDYIPLPDEPSRLYALGRLSNPVISATSYGFALVISCYLFLASASRTRQAAACLAGLILMAAIALTESRTAWLAIAVSIGVVIAIRRRNHAWLVFAGFFVLAGIAMVSVLGIEALTRRALSFRPEIWSEFVSRTIEANLLFGVGSGHDSHWQMPQLLIEHPHSIFVSTLYFGGLTGLALLLVLAGLCAREVFRSPPSALRDLAILTGLFGLTVGIFDGDNPLTKIDFHWWITWLPIATCLILSGREDQEPST